MDGQAMDGYAMRMLAETVAENSRLLRATLPQAYCLTDRLGPGANLCRIYGLGADALKGIMRVHGLYRGEVGQSVTLTLDERLVLDGVMAGRTGDALAGNVGLLAQAVGRRSRGVGRRAALANAKGKRQKAECEAEAGAEAGAE